MAVTAVMNKDDTNARLGMQKLVRFIRWYMEVLSAQAEALRKAKVAVDQALQAHDEAEQAVDRLRNARCERKKALDDLKRLMDANAPVDQATRRVQKAIVELREADAAARPLERWRREALDASDRTDERLDETIEMAERARQEIDRIDRLPALSMHAVLQAVVLLAQARPEPKGHPCHL
jgi:hypothetical protein